MSAPELIYFDAPSLEKDQPPHKIAYYRWGNKDNTNLLFCVHGLTRNGKDFNRIAEQLSEHYQVICPDIAGRGKSDPFANSSQYQYATYMADMLALINHIDVKKLDWLGTSMGGIIGMMIAAFYPDIIRKLVLNDIGALVEKPGLERITTYAGKTANLSNKPAALAYLQNILTSFGVQQDEWDTVFDATFVDDGNGGYRFAYDPRIIEPFKTETNNFTDIKPVDLWQLWEAVQCPTLILRGKESDILSHETAQKMCEKPQCRLVEFDNVGHAPVLLSEAQIAPIRDFLYAG